MASQTGQSVGSQEEHKPGDREKSLQAVVRKVCHVRLAVYHGAPGRPGGGGLHWGHKSGSTGDGLSDSSYRRDRLWLFGRIFHL